MCHIPAQWAYSIHHCLSEGLHWDQPWPWCVVAQCLAQYIMFMRVVSGRMFCVGSIFYECTPYMYCVYLFSTMHNGMKLGLVCVEREGLVEVVRGEGRVGGTKVGEVGLGGAKWVGMSV